MKLLLHNTLTRNKEVFVPLDNNLVKMYVCGPTVYDHPHIGNARSVVVYDILYRSLSKIFGKNHIKYVRNITDIDDKIINRARELKITIADLTAKITEEFHCNMQYLGCKTPNIEPKATMHIDDMVMIIQKLLDLNHAYMADNHVYFDISTSPDYTKLSNRNLNEMLEGVRIENNLSKKHPHDFVLWKPANKDEEILANFDSPWGRGRPGWHIECSAMSYKYLGENFDIHGGGADLIFPHHTNEIAQSTCAFPNSYFAKYWVHNGFLTCNGEKMSKSLNNFITVKDLIDKKIPGDVIRLLLMSSHYRKPLDYNDKALEDAKKTINYWYRAIENLDINKLDVQNVPEEFCSSLFDDLNTPLAIKIINDYAKLVFASTTEEDKYQYASYLLSCSNFIGIMTKPASVWFDYAINDQQGDQLIMQLIAQRQQAKLQKDWLLADQIRQDLLQDGIILEDKPDGSTIWRKV
ncbi:cysteine--tRNA ligase [Candidatus Tisiphia endosymbiont of Mystacides longicornis]|uniref:cysteine--tRNA ligase n=1 Tax=Candidatus Tisiphia endosymbiont of Mystacides longicornis TaxID=3139330 RepID=UPI003CCB326E